MCIPSLPSSLKTTLLSTALSTIALSTIALPAQAAPRKIPYQFITKLYTEALGRAPDQPGWQAMATYFKTNGCNATTLGNLSTWVLTSPEAQALNYDPDAQLLTAYRTILNRDPDESGLRYYQMMIAARQTSFPKILEAFSRSPEFTNLTDRICNSSKPTYSFDGTAAIAIDPSRLLSGEQLQQALNNAPPNSTLSLPEKTLVRLTQPLIIPRSITLQTQGSIPPTRYAQQARLVRTGLWSGSLIQVMPGAQLKHLWIDGQRSANTTPTTSAYASGNYNITMQGGANTAVNFNRITNTAGATNIEVRNTTNNPIDSSEYQCQNNQVLSNLIDAYTSLQTDRQWSDGISIHCEDTEVAYNAVLDATDVGIIIFSYTNPRLNDRVIPQASHVHNNQVINIGNSAFAAYGADPFFTYARDAITNEPRDGDPPCLSNPCQASRSFQGARMVNNLMWTGDEVHYEIGLAIGTRPWFNRNSYTGRGGEFSYNSTGLLRARTDYGIVISGIIDTTVQSNSLNLEATDVSLCPYSTEAAAKRRSGNWRANNIGLGSGFATGNIQDQGSHIIGPFTDCIGKTLNPKRSFWDFLRF